ncbi:bifunctional 2-polyprenyl-6-hydroxyphenol methylase/3-demethylubiquinol 3-O-methyltransferase UbiG [Aliiglaciecola sp. M165]|uniref:bifunctional 2-polyprenyl-6-hydroxyphenol methylase/3-demethylubiquinol 3-O-methyltransferase UbiG n=1 Tax=Aliiglaciecola sp. M165 TaxID=2593649 RepID=UPI001180FB84|nr:bifunctional 2-polyprenyl-6-hydroxyphenol methylase/3-demethylubiquinol 3-O-methyltransferase UbiG [Aliiglaciecola sp. M165]TRY33782.1 bifunctional 2-polyprenyl-6-hydroxyphenol methylase/3-demethylubiquinol 3-O-methyltransferase UbiG [Aliiglaciecola sp. M165]
MLDKSSLSTSLKNLSEQEIARFDALADQWWDPDGKYKTALEFNRARLEFIVQKIRHHFGTDLDGQSPLTILDVGSGGGLISEPLAKQGFEVTGIDPSAVSIEVAKAHAQKSQVDVTYIHGLVGQLDAKAKQYDVVINAEVVEHVPDQQQLIEQCCAMVKPGGLLILATLNRTVKSWIVAILGAEYVMGYLPIGTHSWSKFVKPEELTQWCAKSGFRQTDSVGLSLNPFSKVWSLHNNLSVNYVLSFKHD